MKTISNVVEELICDLELEYESPTEITEEIAYISKSSISVEEYEDCILIYQLETYGILECGEGIASAKIPRYEIDRETLRITKL